MAGHSKWKQIKHKKAAEDEKRGKLFSKLSEQITIAARKGTDPQFNPELRNAVEQAKRHNMPQVNIDRAIERAKGAGGGEPILIEVYGPGGVGLLIEAQTDNRNRTIAELRAIVKDFDAKIAEPGGVVWAFERTADGYRPKFPQPVSDTVKHEVDALARRIAEQRDVAAVFTTTL